MRWASEVAVATVVATPPLGATAGRREARRLGRAASLRLRVRRLRGVRRLREAREVLGDGTPSCSAYGIADEEAWEVGLPCGGEIDVFVEGLDED